MRFRPVERINAGCLWCPNLGTYVSVESFHLFRYLDEQTFRYNQRELNDSERFLLVCGNLVGKRDTYRELIGQGDGGEA